MIAAALVAVTLPTLIAYNLPPSATFFNQAAAFIGWGAWVFMLASLPGVTLQGVWRGGLVALVAMFGLLALAAGVAPFWAALPWTLALSSIGAIAAAVIVAVAGAALARAGHARLAFQALCAALLAAGVIGALLGIEQVFAPQWTDGSWIARIGNGRAAGNLRQPNHLSSLLLWSLVALLWLAERRHVGRLAGIGLGVLLLAGIALSASRTGMLGVLMLGAWGLVDTRLSRRSRAWLIGAPIVFALLWLGLAAWAHHSHHLFGGDAQLGKGDISSSRFAIWANTLTLIAAHPWAGVGWGDFNFAWTLTPFPDRPVAFFDHTHNLVLQFAVELGLPLAALVLALLGVALWRAFRAGTGAAAQAQDDATVSTLRAAFVMVLLMMLHSQLEYPLWYAHFLLPTVFAFGLCLGGAGAEGAQVGVAVTVTVGVPLAAPMTAPTAPTTAHMTAPMAAPMAAQMTASKAPQGSHLLAIGGALILLGALAALADYARVVVIFAPPANAAPLDERIAEGKRSWLFGHHADYAEVTTPGQVIDPVTAFARAPHYLLDVRLMMAWANALAAWGDTDKASYLAARLAEFHNEQADAFFAPCDEPPKEGQEPPFQCEPPKRALTYRDFR